MTRPNLHALADTLRYAEESRAPCPRITDAASDLTVADAYAIQRLNVERRLRCGLHGRPARVVGRKIGITSKAVMEWLKVDEPDFGHLLDDMSLVDGGEVRRDDLVQPRIEAEIAFVLGRDLRGPGVLPQDVLAATDWICAALEVIDSRVAEWKIGYLDTVADNASSARFVLGTTKASLQGVDLPLVGMAMRKNGRVVSTGAGAACLGNPVTAVVWLAEKLAEMGDFLKAGDVVLSGALGPVTPIEKGDFVEAEIAHVGRCTIRVA